MEKASLIQHFYGIFVSFERGGREGEIDIPMRSLVRRSLSRGVLVLLLPLRIQKPIACQQ
jgi:hypothetical protein